MSINYPVSLDNFTNPTSSDYQDTSWVELSVVLSNLNDAVEALETKVGITNSADTSSLDYKTTRLTTKGDILTHNGTNPVRLPKWTDGYMLVADSWEATGLKYIAPTSWGTVTSVSVNSANGFSAIVTSPTATPSIDIQATVTGIIKSNWTAISSATEWTDYYKPGATDVVVSDGGTGVSSLTAYAPIFWGTTSTWAVQSWTIGNAWYVLTDNGAWALPTFQSIWIKKRTSAVQTLVNPSANTVINTTNYGTTVTFDGWLVYGYINGTIQWVDCNGDIGIQYSANNVDWTDIITVNGFAFFWNSFSDAVDSPVEAVILPPWYIRTFWRTSWTSITGSGLTLWTTYFRY